MDMAAYENARVSTGSKKKNSNMNKVSVSRKSPNKSS